MDIDSPAQVESPDQPLVFEHEELPMVLSLGQFLSSSGRMFVSGFQVEDTKMALWYCDRFGLIKSKIFDFIEEPHYLFLMLAGIHFAKEISFGIYPLFLPNINKTIYLRNRTLVIPHAFDVDGNLIGDVQFKVALERNENAAAIPGVLEQGGLVVPVVPMGALKPQGEDVLEAKITWQPRQEQVYIRRIRSSLSRTPEGLGCLKHIVELKCSSIISPDDPMLQLPRIFMMGKESIPGNVSHLEILITRRYLPLAQVKNAAQLRTVFGGALIGMFFRHLFEPSGLTSQPSLTRSSLGMGECRCPTSKHQS